MNSFLSYIWWGKISKDLLMIGTIDAFVVASPVSMIIIFFVNKIKQTRVINAQLQEEVQSRIQAEEALQKAHDELEDRVKQRTFELEKANLAKSQFLANMSHEIRTPLNGIIGMTSLIADTILSDTQRHYFEIVHNEAKALNTLINGILDFSKIEAGRLELENIPFDLRYLFDNFASTFYRQAEQKQISFSADLPADLCLKLVGDPGRLRQILVNLTGNALKFTPQGGTISVKGQKVAETETHVTIKFMVEDTGIGIRPEKQQSIFNSFTQADGSTARQFGGTGLGTTISKQLAESMGGEIGLTSEEGKGSLFWFTVVLRKHSVAEGVAENAKNGFSGLKILVADDKTSNRRTLADDLHSLGCTVVEVQGGVEALEKIKSTAPEDNFDLLFCELHQTNMNGFELARHIKEDINYSGIPIIIVTTSGTRGDGVKCKELDIAGYLTRPISRHNLKGAVTALFELEADLHNTPEERQLITRHFLSENPHIEGHILLAEDYHTNQQVVKAYLENEGFSVDLADNGAQAIEAAKNKTYDLILMDVQMPVVDGFRATRDIRALEKEKQSRPQDSNRIPIIALTAHATTGDRQKCLEADMDDYLTKPINRENLIQTVQFWLYGMPSQKTRTTKPIKINGEAPFDFENIVELFRGNRKKVLKVVEDFLDTAEAQVKIMEHCLDQGDLETLKKQAHSIKGGAGNIKAKKMAAAAKQLEETAAGSELSDSTLKIKQLHDEIKIMKDYLQSLNATLEG